MIEINGLSLKQVKLLDTMWSINTMEDVENWMETLPVSDAADCILLMELIRLECIDEETQSYDGFLEATSVINHIKSL